MSTQTITIHVNGEARAVNPELTITALLAELGIRPERVAVELNRVIVKQPQWADTQIPPGAELEIVQFVGGG